MSESSLHLTTPVKVLVGVLAVADAGFGAVLALRLVRGLSPWLIGGAFAATVLVAVAAYRLSRARALKRGYEGLRDLTVGDEGLRVPAGTLSTRLVPWSQIADVSTRRSARFGDGYLRDALWVDLVTGGGIESSVQRYTPRGRLRPAPPQRRQFEQTAILDPALFDAVVERLRKELRHRQLHAQLRSLPRIR
ncbi:PH domain-containing protein [Amycolatopsis australiensis]|uniref:PH domain-containing protein n=1 Tax=Amycolatopsis australiensis TaxID=546364 RepID=A0A1K1RP55_9PSEU|nr:PH domain-containing protein [Amycolatopsis australiensis]SFW74043.1 PH domain-containing protein [Amycolatopsis australiensis]